MDTGKETKDVDASSKIEWQLPSKRPASGLWVFLLGGCDHHDIYGFSNSSHIVHYTYV